ncbi:hypothetical protein, partial [Spirosoma arboris]|uniref:hypothetical protein n=1 Tax=Spirosoma arboris TaxID=2682092 RepID=UPI0018DDED6B
IIDVSEGGLLCGPPLTQGGIALLGCNKDGEVFISGQAEGWQFLINAFAEFDNQKVLLPLSKHAQLADFLFVPYSVPAHINVFTVVPKEVEGKLITPVLFHCTNYLGVMPRVPAKANLSFLDIINREAWLKHYVEKQPEGTMRDSALIARFGSGSKDN